MAKEYTHRHGRRKRKGAKKRRKSKKKKKHARVAPGFRRRRRYASQPRHPPPASVLHERTTHAMMMELARQLLGPRFPGANKITQQGPPFLPYDPWARQRNLIRHQDEQRLEQMRRIAEQEVRDARVEDAALEDDE